MKTNRYPIHLLNANPKHGRYANRQRGIVMVISMIILLALTIIGVSGSQVTGLEENMVANAKDYNLAFQAADTALKAAEFKIANGLAPLPSGAGYYPNINGTPILEANPDVWTTSGGYATYTDGTLKGVVKAPEFIIELINTSTQDVGSSSLESTGAQGESQDISFYRVTARGTGSNQNSVAIVQSIYKK